MKMPIRKRDIAYAVSLTTQLEAPMAQRAVDAVFRAITSSLVAGRPVAVQGFGKFQLKDRAARGSRNPRTGESMQVPARKAVSFSVSPTLKEAIQCE